MQSMTFLSTSYHEDDSICIGQIVTWESRSMRITCWNASNIPNFQCVYSPSLIAFKSENEADFYVQHTIGWLLTSYLWAEFSEIEFRFTFQSRFGNNAEIQYKVSAWKMPISMTELEQYFAALELASELKKCPCWSVKIITGYFQISFLSPEWLGISTLGGIC